VWEHKEGLGKFEEGAKVGQSPPCPQQKGNLMVDSEKGGEIKDGKRECLEGEKGDT